MGMLVGWGLEILTTGMFIAACMLHACMYLTPWAKLCSLIPNILLKVKQTYKIQGFRIEHIKIVRPSRDIDVFYIPILSVMFI